MRTRVMTTVFAVFAALAAPSVAGATTFCVNDPACVGTTSASIDAAVASANANPGADTIRIGAQAAPYVLAAAVSTNPAQQITIIGAGSTATRIQQPVGDTGLTVAGVSPTVRGLGFVTVAGGSSSDYGLNAYPNSGALTVDDITVTGTGRAGLGLLGPGTASNIHVTLPLAVSSANYSIGIDAGSLPSGTLTMTDVTSTADLGIQDTSTAGTLVINRASVVSTIWGIFLRPSNSGGATSTLQVSSTLVRMTTAAAGTVESTAFKVEPSSGINNTSASATLYEVTLVGASNPGPNVTSERGLVGSTNGLGNTSTAAIATDAVIITGFDHAVRSSSSVPSSSTVTLTRVNHDPTGNELVGTGVITNSIGNVNVDPQFVDPASFDFRLRWGSPMIDTGSATLLAWESATDLDGLTRPVWATVGAVGAPKLDFGAYEYHRLAPTVGLGPDRTVDPGESVSVSALATDPNSGEGASLTYSWTTPTGITPGTGSITFTAPTTPGTYNIVVVATDVSNTVGSDSFTLTVRTPAAPPTPANPNPPAATRTAVTVLTRAFAGRRGLTCGGSIVLACAVPRAIVGSPMSAFTIKVSASPLAAVPPRVATVVVQKRVGGKWVQAQKPTLLRLDVDRIGTWAMPRVLRTTAATRYRVQVKTGETGTAKAGVSVWRYLRIS